MLGNVLRSGTDPRRMDRSGLRGIRLRPSGRAAGERSPSGRQRGEHSMARVLVVDDERNYLLALDAFLSGQGHEVVTTTSALEGFKRVEDETLGCGIVDLQMPGMPEC